MDRSVARLQVTVVRTLSGLPILTGFVLFWISLVTGPRCQKPPCPDEPRGSRNNVAFEEVPAVSHDLIPDRWLSYAHVVAFGECGFFALSFLILSATPS